MLESVFLRGGRLDAESQQTSVPQREKNRGVLIMFLDNASLIPIIKEHHFII